MLGGGTECFTARLTPARYSSGDRAGTWRITPPAMMKPKAWIG